MSQSSLATYRNISPNCTKPRSKKIMGVAIHCTAGHPDNTAKQIVDGARFVTKSSNGASCHYAVGGDGSIAQGCLEENRAWCTSHAIDHSIITIEVASDTKGLVVRDKAINSLVNLLADICRRNGITKLLWKADKSLMGQWTYQNMVVHRWTSAKACPGDYLYSKHTEIANRVNALLRSTIVEPKKDEEMDIDKFVNDLTNEQAYLILQKARHYMAGLTAPEWSKESLDKAVEKQITDGKRPCDLITRAEAVTMIERAITD